MRKLSLVKIDENDSWPQLYSFDCIIDIANNIVNIVNNIVNSDSSDEYDNSIEWRNYDDDDDDDGGGDFGLFDDI